MLSNEAKHREKAQERRRNLGAASAATAIDHRDASALAAAMQIIPDPKEAARLVGISDPKRAKLLTAIARKHHRDLIDGDRKGLEKRNRTAIGMTLAEITYRIRAGELSGRDLTNTLLRLAFFSSNYLGEEKDHDFSELRLVLTGPEGEEVELGADGVQVSEK